MTPGFSGADIASMVNNAVIKSVDQGLNEIRLKELDESRDRIYLGIKKFRPYKTEEQMNHSAVHQAGHALICLDNPICRKNIYKVTIEKYSDSNGETIVQDEEKQSTIEDLYSQIDMAIGGVLAEEIVFGKKKLTSGCGKDLNQVSYIAEKLVKKFGMNKDWGYSVVNEEASQHKISEESRNKLASSTQDIIHKSEIRVRRVLNERKNILLDIAHKLVKNKSLNKRELHEFL